MDQPTLNPERIRLGARLRACRVAAGLSRRDVAAVLGLGERRIGAFERGAAAIPAIELFRLAGRFKLPITSFFDATASSGPVGLAPTPCEIMAVSDDGAALAEAFVKIKTPRVRRHLVQLAEELVSQEARG